MDTEESTVTIAAEGTNRQPKTAVQESPRPSVVVVRLQALDSPRDPNTVSVTIERLLGSTRVDKSRCNMIHGVVAYHHESPVDKQQLDNTSIDMVTVFFATGSGVDDLAGYLYHYGGADGRQIVMLLETLMQRAAANTGKAITVVEEEMKISASSIVIPSLAEYFDTVNNVAMSE